MGQVGCVHECVWMTKGDGSMGVGIVSGTTVEVRASADMLLLNILCGKLCITVQSCKHLE